MNLAHHLEASASFFPDRPALRQFDLEIPYTRLNEQANRIATGLMKLGVKPGDPIALCTVNSADWIAFYFGVLKAGAVAVTLAGMLTGDELNQLLRHSKTRYLFTSEDKLSGLKDTRARDRLEKVICPGGDIDLEHLMKLGSASFKAIERNRSDTAAVLYTGGTTGTPKGVMLTHEGIIFSSVSIMNYEHSTEKDVAICYLPFNHVFGQIHIMNATILSAGCLEILPSFDMEQVLKLIESGRVTKFFAVPTVYVRFLGLPDLEKRIGKLRYCFSAGASMAREIVKQWKDRTGITIAESYGMTEGMPITFNHYYPDRHVIGSVGQPVHGMEVQIRDASGNLLEPGQEGEVCIRGRSVMTAYLDNPEATCAGFWENGWFRTGDVGQFDSNGYLYLVDRLKDLIITGGENVYPREVEEILYTCAEVDVCAVVGLPDKEWGERVTAFIVCKPGKTIVPENLKKRLKSCLAPFKVPKEFVVVNELPKGPTGKILKREIKKEFIEGRLRPGG